MREDVSNNRSLKENEIEKKKQIIIVWNKTNIIGKKALLGKFNTFIGIKRFCANTSWELKTCYKEKIINKNTVMIAKRVFSLFANSHNAMVLTDNKLIV